MKFLLTAVSSLALFAGIHFANAEPPVPWQCNVPKATGYNGAPGTIMGPTGRPFVTGPMPAIMAQDIDRRNQMACEAGLQAQREQAEKERQYYTWLEQERLKAEATQKAAAEAERKRAEAAAQWHDAVAAA